MFANNPDNDQWEICKSAHWASITADGSGQPAVVSERLTARHTQKKPLSAMQSYRESVLSCLSWSYFGLHQFSAKECQIVQYLTADGAISI